MLRFALACALIIETLALAGLATRVDPVGQPAILFVAWTVAVAATMVALLALRGIRIGAPVILAIAVALRLPLIAAEPTLSDDVWRYLHDGRAQLAGVSPYAFAPDDDRTIPFRGADHSRINHPHLLTIYPPAAQLAFAAAAALGASLLSWKLVALVAELLLMLALVALLRARGRDERLVAIYAWHPLAIIEVAANGHLEPLAIASLLWALLWAARSRAVAAGAVFAVAVAAKYWPAPLLPFLMRAHPRRTLIATLAVLLALYAPYVLAGPAPIGSALIFARTWESNAGLFALAAAGLGTRERALAASAIALAALLAILWRRRARAEDAAFVFIFATLLASPVVHPWYLLWLLALLPAAIMPPAVVAAAAWWTLTAPAAYTVLPSFAATGVWHVPPLATALQLAPVIALIAAAAVREAVRRSRRSVALPAA
jgi:hypothetical protein